MEHLNQAVSWANNLSALFTAFAGMFTSLGSAITAISIAFFTFAGICAAAATRMPKPNETAPIAYIMLYRFITVVAFNFGHAENK